MLLHFLQQHTIFNDNIKQIDIFMKFLKVNKILILLENKVDSDLLHHLRELCGERVNVLASRAGDAGSIPV